MNKFFTKVASLCVGLAMAAGVGVAVGAAKASPVKAAEALDTSYDLSNNVPDGLTASVSLSKDSNNRGMGKAGTTYTLTTSKSFENVTKIVVNAATNYGTYANHSISATVGGSAFGSAVNFSAKASTDYQITSAAASGAVVVSLNNSAAGTTKSNTIWCKTIEVYTDGGGSTTYYTVTDNVEHGTLNKTSVAEGTTLTTTITPDSGYKVPDSVTVTMGGSPVTFGYNAGVITVQNVSGDINIVASCIALEEYSVSYVPVDHGSGAYNDSGLENSQYTLVAFADTGIVAENGYRFKNYEVDSVSYDAGAKITLTENIEVSVIFELIPEGDEGLIKFSTTDVKIDGASVTGDDSLGNTWTITTEGTTSFTANAAYYQVGSSSKPATSITFTTTLSQSKKVSSFEAKFGGFSGTAGDIALKVGDTTVGSGSLNASTDIVVEASSQEVGTVLTVTVTNIAKGVKVYYISYTLVNASAKTLDIQLDQASSGPFNINYSSSSFLFYAMDGEDIIDADWTVGDSAILSVSENSNHVAVVNTLKDGTTTLTASATGYNACISQVTVSAGTVSSISITGSMTKKQYTTSEAWNPGGFVVTATYSTGLEKDVTEDVSWSYNPAAPAENVEAVTATASYGGKSSTSSSQSVTVTVAHAGTAEDPFTVAEALAKANEIGAVGKTGQGPWVTRGVISRVTSAPAATYWNATYYISDDGKQANELQVYRGFYLDNAKFDAETALLLVPGATVVVTGNLTGSYGCEYCQGNYLLDIQQPESGDIDVTFQPAVFLGVGDSGTYTASTEAANPTYSFSSDNSSILSVSSDGAYSAVSAGSATVRVDVTSSDGNGYKEVAVTVVEVKTVSQAYDIAAALASGATTDYSIKVTGAISSLDADGKARAINFTDGFQVIEVFFGGGNADYTTVKNNGVIGSKVTVFGKVQNYSGTYELKDITLAGVVGGDADSYAAGAYKSLDGSCETGPAAVTEDQWTAVSNGYSALSLADQAKFRDADLTPHGENVVNWVDRYERIVSQTELANFMSLSNIAGRLAFGSNGVVDSDSAMIIVIIAAVTSLTSIAVLLVIKRRKTLVK